MQVFVSKSQPRDKLEQDFLRAVKDGKKDEVKELLEMVNVNIQNDDGWTALMWASSFKRYLRSTDRKEIVELLLKAGANPNIKGDNGWTALMFASGESNEDIVKLLLDAGADKDIQNKYGWTALIMASGWALLHRAAKETVKLLLEAGADVDVRDKEGHTALWHASDNDRTNTVELLLDAGADKDILISPYYHIFPKQLL